jgi:hypothetical protein
MDMYCMFDNIEFTASVSFAGPYIVTMEYVAGRNETIPYSTKFSVDPGPNSAMFLSF